MQRPPKDRQERLTADDLTKDERKLSDNELRSALGSSPSAELAKQSLRAAADSTRHSHRASTDSVFPGTERTADERRALSDERGREDDALVRERIAADDALMRSHGELGEVFRRLLASERDAMDLRMRDERASADARLAIRDEFLAMVCHDLRSLLAAVAMRASLLARDPRRQGAGAASPPGSDAIQRVVTRMNLLIGDLLDVVAMESGRFAIDAQAHPAATLLAETARELLPSAKARDLQLVLRPSAGECWAALDVNRIQQVLTNLIGNAVKFTPAGGRIEIGVTARAREVVFEVADTGPGIPAGKVQEVFERFTQLTPDTQVGLGLGLFICKNIVEAHRGRIWVEHREGGGSRFLFAVPATDARPAPAA